MNDEIAAALVHEIKSMNKTLDIICKSLKLLSSGDLK